MAIYGIDALIKESETNISISDSPNKLTVTTDQPEYQYINVESDAKGMNGRLDKLESDIGRIDGSLNEINGTLNSLKSLPNQAKTANLIGGIILAALAIIAGLFTSNTSRYQTMLRL